MFVEDGHEILPNVVLHGQAERYPSEQRAVNRQEPLLLQPWVGIHPDHAELTFVAPEVRLRQRQAPKHFRARLIERNVERNAIPIVFNLPGCFERTASSTGVVKANPSVAIGIVRPLKRVTLIFREAEDS